MKVFMDLEQTIIDNWYSKRLMNVEKLNNFYRLNNVEDISIWSFAINDAEDLGHFYCHLHETLEDVLGVHIDVTDTGDATLEVCEREQLEFEDLCYYLNKFRTFVAYARHHCKGQTVVLLDDDVPNTELHFKDDNLRIITINVLEDNKWEDTLIT